MTSTSAPRTPYIYLDNAATTWPKPLAVREAVGKALVSYGANPGRSGHAMGMAAADEVYRCREAAAAFFHADNPSRIIFTQNCTMALNMAIKGIARQGGRFIVSDVEHNSVMRPLHSLSTAARPVFDIAQVVPGNTAATVAAFERCITPATRAIVCTQASNVFGLRLPIRELGALAHRYNLLFVVDGAQSAGIVPLDVQRDNIDFLCLPGHKGLYGPMGTGLLVCAGEEPLNTLMEGGTGSFSMSWDQPDELPDRLESGTLNVPGICGLHAGIDFVSRRGVTAIAEEETALMARLYQKLACLRGVQLYTPCPDGDNWLPLLSLTLENQPSEQTAAALSQQGIAVRAGLHCAPGAHRKFGTAETGTVRLAPGAFTTRADVDRAADVIRRLCFSSR